MAGFLNGVAQGLDVGNKAFDLYDKVSMNRELKDAPDDASRAEVYAKYGHHDKSIAVKSAGLQNRRAEQQIAEGDDKAASLKELRNVVGEVGKYNDSMDTLWGELNTKVTNGEMTHAEATAAYLNGYNKNLNDGTNAYLDPNTNQIMLGNDSGTVRVFKLPDGSAATITPENFNQLPTLAKKRGEQHLKTAYQKYNPEAISEGLKLSQQNEQFGMTHGLAVKSQEADADYKNRNLAQNQNQFDQTLGYKSAEHNSNQELEREKIQAGLNAARISAGARNQPAPLNEAQAYALSQLQKTDEEKAQIIELVRSGQMPEVEGAKRINMLNAKYGGGNLPLPKQPTPLTLTDLAKAQEMAAGNLHASGVNPKSDGYAQMLEFETKNILSSVGYGTPQTINNAPPQVGKKIDEGSPSVLRPAGSAPVRQGRTITPLGMQQPRGYSPTQNN